MPPPADLLAAGLPAALADPTLPLITYYDDDRPERTELSGASLANWIAKTANLLTDEVDAQPGDHALISLPPHWQTAVVLLGCWWAGLTVTYRRPADAPGSVGAVVTFTAHADADNPPEGEGYLLGLRPFGLALPAGSVPDGWQDYIAAVRGQGDRYLAAALPGELYATTGSSRAQLTARVHERARELGLHQGDRALVDTTTHPDPLDWLLAPLAVGASAVLCGPLVGEGRLDSIAEAERVTAWVGRRGG